MIDGMADPFLSAHEIAPSCFDLTGRYLPASIRDQMLRAYFVVQRLDERKRISGSRVLVVGIGACGVTAGIEAARLGSQVTMIDEAPRPFSAQRGISSRWVDPTQYDWPVSHWTAGRFPINLKPVMPLEWASGTASEIVTDWDAQLYQEEKIHGQNLKLEYLTKFGHVMTKEGDAQIQVEMSDKNGIRRESYDHVFFCHGFGSETTMIGRFVGTPFWGDPFEYPGWNTGGKQILIVGGGDGALQDFLITVTGKNSAREIFESVIPSSAQSTISQAIHSVEDQAQRSLLWSVGQNHDHPILRNPGTRPRCNCFGPA